MSINLDLAELSELTLEAPLQYQKHIRLQEARRLLLSRRFFGRSPLRDLQRLREIGYERYAAPDGSPALPDGKITGTRAAG